MAKPHVTRTFGPIHFEDLDPHRFEDLIRQLTYDFRQWQSIESTGRSGADDGFDIRAYEALAVATIAPDEDGEQEEIPHPMEGNLWMIQCKREKEIGPTKITKIIKDAISPNNPPYGYILAASAHFSKAAHDKFRETLRNLGVMEFYLWGAGELEDMLYQPKNDHILFAFFGISLATRRRLRTTEVRATVNAKNKLLRALGEYPQSQPVLLRDLKDTNYPYEESYADFDKRPRWKGYPVIQFHPLGLIVAIGKYYAYIDKAKGEWAFTKAANQIFPVSASHTPFDKYADAKRNAVKGFWQQLRHVNRATFIRHGLVRYDSMAFIDDKGDSEYKCPHLFVDFHSERGAFSGMIEYLEINEDHTESLEGLKRITIFPETFPEPRFGTIHKDKFIVLDDKARASLKHSCEVITIYDVSKQYAYLKPTDVIAIDKSEDREGKKTLLKITNIRTVSGKELRDLCSNDPSQSIHIENQIGRELKIPDKILIIEALTLHDWQIEQNRPVV